MNSFLSAVIRKFTQVSGPDVLRSVVILHDLLVLKTEWFGTRRNFEEFQSRMIVRNICVLRADLGFCFCDIRRMIRSDLHVDSGDTHPKLMAALIVTGLQKLQTCSRETR